MRSPRASRTSCTKPKIGWERHTDTKPNVDLKVFLCHPDEASPLQVVIIEESLEDVTRQNGCLRSDLLDVQHERDFLKRDVTVLRKQLQNVNEKV